MLWTGWLEPVGPPPLSSTRPAKLLGAVHPLLLVLLGDLDALVAADLRLDDGADDGDARALDEDREEDADERLEELSDEIRVLQAERRRGDGAEERGDDARDQEGLRALRDVVAEGADVREPLDLIGAQRVQPVATSLDPSTSG